MRLLCLQREQEVGTAKGAGRACRQLSPGLFITTASPRPHAPGWLQMAVIPSACSK